MGHYRHIAIAVAATFLMAACLPGPASSPIPGSSDATANPIPGGSDDLATALQSLFGSDIMAETTRAGSSQQDFVELTESNWKAVVEESKLPVWVFFREYAGHMDGTLQVMRLLYGKLMDRIAVATLSYEDQPALFKKHYEGDALILVYKQGKVVDRWSSSSKSQDLAALFKKYS